MANYLVNGFFIFFFILFLLLNSIGFLEKKKKKRFMATNNYQVDKSNKKMPPKLPSHRNDWSQMLNKFRNQNSKKYT